MESHTKDSNLLRIILFVRSFHKEIRSGEYKCLEWRVMTLILQEWLLFDRLPWRNCTIDQIDTCTMLYCRSSSFLYLIPLFCWKCIELVSHHGLNHDILHIYLLECPFGELLSYSDNPELPLVRLPFAQLALRIDRLSSDKFFPSTILYPYCIEYILDVSQHIDSKSVRILTQFSMRLLVMPSLWVLKGPMVDNVAPAP